MGFFIVTYKRAIFSKHIAYFQKVITMRAERIRTRQLRNHEQST